MRPPNDNDMKTRRPCTHRFVVDIVPVVMVMVSYRDNVKEDVDNASSKKQKAVAEASSETAA